MRSWDFNRGQRNGYPFCAIRFIRRYNVRIRLRKVEKRERKEVKGRRHLNRRRRNSLVSGQQSQFNWLPIHSAGSNFRSVVRRTLALRLFGAPVLSSKVLATPTFHYRCLAEFPGKRFDVWLSYAS